MHFSFINELKKFSEFVAENVNKQVDTVEKYININFLDDGSIECEYKYENYDSPDDFHTDESVFMKYNSDYHIVFYDIDIKKYRKFSYD